MNKNDLKNAKMSKTSFTVGIAQDFFQTLPVETQTTIKNEKPKIYNAIFGEDIFIESSIIESFFNEYEPSFDKVKTYAEFEKLELKKQVIFKEIFAKKYKKLQVATQTNNNLNIMNQNSTTAELILNEITEFNELLNPSDCMETISRMFFHYFGATIDQRFANEITQPELRLIEHILGFLKECKDEKKGEQWLHYLLSQQNLLNCRTGLNKIFFKYLKSSFDYDNNILELNDIQNMEILFEFLNTVEGIITNQNNEKEILESITH